MDESPDSVKHEKQGGGGGGNEDTAESPESEYYYTLHINPKVILCSTDPDAPRNCDYDIEHEPNTKPNLFIVQKASSAYNASEWLQYHGHHGDIERAAELLGDSSISLLICTGAGMGCDSNLPDYRSPGGFWNDYGPLKNNKLSLHDMSTTNWFKSDPQSAWGFYAHRAKLYRDAVPHGGFKVLYNITNNGGDYSSRPRDYHYMTSNIDGQAIKAGFTQRKLYQTHGSLHHLQCLSFCDDAEIIPFFDGYHGLDIDSKTLQIADLKQVPSCKHCGGLMRPNVSFFSDTSDTFDDERICEQKEKFMKWLKPFTKKRKKGKKQRLVVVEIGCGKSVHSLRWECEYMAEQDNVTLIRINPTEKIEMKGLKEERGKRLEKEERPRHITLKLPAKMALEAIEKCIEKKE